MADIMNDDFYIRLKIFVMFAELVNDAVYRQDTTYLKPFVNSGLADIAADVMIEYYPNERKAFADKLESVSNIMDYHEEETPDVNSVE